MHNTSAQCEESQNDAAPKPDVSGQSESARPPIDQGASEFSLRAEDRDRIKALSQGNQEPVTTSTPLETFHSTESFNVTIEVPLVEMPVAGVPAGGATTAVCLTFVGIVAVSFFLWRRSVRQQRSEANP